MSFEEWWAKYYGEIVDGMPRKDIAEDAWEAALENQWQPHSK